MNFTDIVDMELSSCTLIDVTFIYLFNDFQIETPVVSLNLFAYIYQYILATDMASF